MTCLLVASASCAQTKYDRVAATISIVSYSLSKTFCKCIVCVFALGRDVSHYLHCRTLCSRTIFALHCSNNVCRGLLFLA
jgi:hypothetical protein